MIGQQGVIPLNSDKQEERRFLIFGGIVGSDFTDSTYVFTENMGDFMKSNLKKLSKEENPKMVLPVGDKFFIQ